MTELDDAVVDILRQRAVRRLRIRGDAGGAAVDVSALLEVVCERVGEREGLEAQLDDAVNRLGGQRINEADTAGFGSRLRRLFERFSKRPKDIYEFPLSVISRPYHEPR